MDEIFTAPQSDESQRVEDPEKARAMAEAEKPMQEAALESDRRASQWVGHELTPLEKEIGSEHNETYHRNTAEYFRGVANEEGERAGQQYDAQHVVSNQSATQEGQQPEQQPATPLTPEQAKLLEPNEKSIFGLLMYGDEALEEIIEGRAKDQTGRFEYCRDLGSKIAEARQARHMTLDVLAFEAGESPRYLHLIESGALDWNFVSDEAVDALSEVLGVTLPYSADKSEQSG